MGSVNLLPVDPQGTKTLEEYVRYIADVLAMLQDDLQNILEGRLSSANIRELTADKIITGTLWAQLVTIMSDLNGGAYIRIDGNGMVINDGTKDVFSVDINGNATFRGDIRAGASIDIGTDARIGNTLYLNEFDGTGKKGIVFSSAAGQTASISAQSGDVGIQAAGFITFTIGSSQGAVFNQRVQAPNFNATQSITINNEAVATEGFVNRGLSKKADGSGFNGIVLPGQTITVKDGVITGTS